MPIMDFQSCWALTSSFLPAYHTITIRKLQHPYTHSLTTSYLPQFYLSTLAPRPSALAHLCTMDPRHLVAESDDGGRSHVLESNGDHGSERHSGARYVERTTPQLHGWRTDEEIYNDAVMEAWALGKPLRRTESRQFGREAPCHPDAELSVHQQAAGNAEHRKAQAGSAVIKARRKRGRRGAKKRAGSKSNCHSVDVADMTPEQYEDIMDEIDEDYVEYYADLRTSGDTRGHPEGHVQSAVITSPRTQGKRSAKKRGMGSKPNDGTIDADHLTPEQHHKITDDSDHNTDTEYHAAQTAGVSEWPGTRGRPGVNKRDQDAP
jgi:hypothetical protein